MCSNGTSISRHDVYRNNRGYPFPTWVARELHLGPQVSNSISCIRIPAFAESLSDRAANHRRSSPNPSGNIIYPGGLCNREQSDLAVPPVPGYNPDGIFSDQTSWDPQASTWFVTCGNDPNPLRPFRGYGDITYPGWITGLVPATTPSRPQLRRSVGALASECFPNTYSHSIDGASRWRRIW